MFDCYWGIQEYGNTGIRDVTFVLSPSCVPPVASDQRSSGLLVFLFSFISYTFYIIYAREGALVLRHLRRVIDAHRAAGGAHVTSTDTIRSFFTLSGGHVVHTAGDSDCTAA